jgi:hypothetical protein
MKRWIFWAAKLYPRSWRDRYGPEFEAFLEDLAPSWWDFWDVLWDALSLRGRAIVRPSLEACSGTGLISGNVSFRSAITLALLFHGVALTSVVALSSLSVAPLPPAARPTAPVPPPAPPPPTAITDPRVFASASLFSSLPFNPSGTYIAQGVGIRFFELPDIGKIDRLQEPIRRVWPGQALEGNIIRRVIPRFPPEVFGRQTVSVFLEYVIGTDGSVKVLRTLGPASFANAARTALEKWQYRPIQFQNRTIEVVSRLEVRFDGALAAKNELYPPRSRLSGAHQE